MSLISDMYTALTASTALTALLDKGKKSIVKDETQSSGSYPVLIYQIINDTPHQFADDAEIARRVTVQISIKTEDGADSAISDIVEEIMADLGWMRQYTTSFTEDNKRIKAMRFIFAEEE